MLTTSPVSSARPMNSDGTDDAALRVIPAHQRFDADDRVGGELDDRLIVHDEALPFDGAAQIVFEREQLQRVRVHRRVEHAMTRFPFGLRAIHRRVRVADHVLGHVVLPRAERDADAGGGEDFVAAEHERHVERREDALGHGGRFERIFEIVEQHRELVAAEPRDGVAGPDRLAQHAADRDQQLVADRVAEAVVDQLEAIEIEEQHRDEPVGVALQARERAAEAIEEQRAIRQSRQRVVEGVVQQLLLEAAALGDV